MRGRRLLIAAIGAASLLLIVPAAAAAAVRYAAPADTGDGDCGSAADACDLLQAVSGASGTDEVIVRGAGSSYDLGSSGVGTNAALYIHGAAGQPLPRIFSSAPGGGIEITNANARVARLRVEYGGAQAGLVMADGIAEQLVVHSTSAGYACELSSAGTLRDSVCAMDPINAGVGVRAERLAGSGTETLRNVTAIGSRGIQAATANSGVSLTVDAKNVIAAGATDVEAIANGGSSTTVMLSHSNYNTRIPASPSGGSFVTAPSTNRNQVASPLFTDALSGAFHQAPGSPTIDAGVGNLLNGTADIDGDKRALDGNHDCVVQADIGADEYVDDSPPACSSPPPSSGAAPDTEIDKGPKRKTSRRKAKFRFSSDDPTASFECRLDKKDFAHCTSPQEYKKLKRRKHRFEVRAIDRAGNVDATPDELSWKVKKKR